MLMILTTEALAIQIQRTTHTCVCFRLLIANLSKVGRTGFLKTHTNCFCEVVNNKKYRGQMTSTPLTRSFSEQGVKFKIKKETRGGYVSKSGPSSVETDKDLVDVVPEDFRQQIRTCRSRLHIHTLGQLIIPLHRVSTHHRPRIVNFRRLRFTILSYIVRSTHPMQLMTTSVK